MPDHRTAPSTWMRLAWLGVLWLVGPGATGTLAAEPPARLLPSGGLTSYLEYDGLDAHAGAWKSSAAREILVDKAAGPLLLDVERRMLDPLLKMAFPDGKTTGADFIALQDHLAGQGFAFATYEDEGESSTAFVLNGFGGPGGLDRFESLLRSLLRMGADDRFPDPTRLRGRELRGFGGVKADEVEPPAPAFDNPLAALRAKRPPSGLTWWREGDALIVVKGPISNPMRALFDPDLANKDLRKLHQARVSAVLDAIEAKGPSVATHPAYAGSTLEGRDLPGFEPSGLFFAEAKEGRGVLDGVDDELNLFEIMDLRRANRIVGRWGFRGKSLLTDVRFEAPTPWKGLLGQVDPRGFPKVSIPPIPRGMGTFVVGPVARGNPFEEMAPLRAALKPEALAFLDLAEQMISEATTPRRRDDLLGRLGPTWCAYASPGGGGMFSVLPTFLIGFDDAEKVDRALEALAAEINADLARRLGDRGASKPVGDAKPALALERLPAPDRGYRLASSAGLIPWLSDDLRPTVLVGKSSLAVAANPALARAAIAAESDPDRRWKPAGELARAFEALPPNVSFVSVGNPRDSSWPEAIVNLPGTAGSFLEKFLHVDLGTGPPASRPPDLLDALGVPKDIAPGAGGASARVDELRATIHPSLLAASVEERSFRVIALEALPLACLWIEAHFQPGGKMNVEVKFSPKN